MSWCEANRVDYVLGLAKNERLKAEITPELEQAAAEYAATGKAARVFKGFTYQTRESWSRARRVIAKAEHLEKGSNPRFVVTSLAAETWPAQALYEDLDCARGEMENRIKEQLMLFADRTSTAFLRSNQIRLYFSSAAYLLMHALRRLGLRGTELARAQCSTIRLKLLKIGALIRITVRRVWLSLAGGYPYGELLRQVYAQLQAAPLRRCAWSREIFHNRATAQASRRVLAPPRTASCGRPQPPSRFPNAAAPPLAPPPRPIQPPF